ncbi:MAG: 3-deoxy-manno-octulosonate-8-phosphatase KdsC [Methylophilaceae bacterium]|nr:MAG: 3-deoxy-manno-octulosonate-8-phosphatase KdsC [Methylophilaceae bacterium]
MSEVTETVLARAKNIKVIIFDVDGVMTDGGLTIGDDAQEYKTFHAHDGLGMKLLKKSGVQMAIITGRTSKVVTTRAETTGIAHFYQGVEDKLVAFNDLIKELNVKPEEAAFMGDDIVDVPPMLRCGLAISVPAAPSSVKERAHYVTTRQGGKGAVREVCELLMKAQGTYDAITAQYFK